MALHWHIKNRAIDFKGFYIFLIAKKAEKDDFSPKSDEDGLTWKRVRKSLRSKRDSHLFERSRQQLATLIEQSKQKEIDLF